MNNRQIAALLSKDVRGKRIFGGIYPIDKLPKYLTHRGPIGFVINTDNSQGPGEHWVAVWFDGKGKAEFFDSLGLPPSVYPEIEYFIFRNARTYRYNRRLLQDLTSSACGFYVLFYLLKKARGASLSRALSPFRPYTLKTNDRLAQKGVCGILRRK